MRASQDGHARRNKTWNGTTTKSRRSRFNNVRLGGKADNLAEPAPTEKGATAADSATSEEETPAKKGWRPLVSVECEH